MYKASDNFDVDVVHKYNWEIEETMERATVTLETERAKWPNPGCL